MPVYQELAEQTSIFTPTELAHKVLHREPDRIAALKQRGDFFTAEIENDNTRAAYYPISPKFELPNTCNFPFAEPFNELRTFIANHCPEERKRLWQANLFGIPFKIPRLD